MQRRVMQLARSGLSRSRSAGLRAAASVASAGPNPARLATSAVRPGANPMALRSTTLSRPALTRGFAAGDFDGDYDGDDDDGEYFGEDDLDDDDLYIRYPPASVRVGARAPGFTASAVHQGEITELSLQDYRGQYVVLFFYPKDFTYVCPTEIIAFNDRAAEFEALGAQLIAVSTDSAESHLAWTKMPRNQGGLGHMKIPLVADLTKLISAKYGVLIEDAGIALRGLFIIDRDGVVQQMTVNNLPIGRSVDETLRLIQALQFVEAHGEVCPANWKPGDKTIIADPKHAHKYFSTVEDADEREEYAGTTRIQTKADFEALVRSGKTVVAKFEAPWCGKCAQIQPFVRDLAAAHPNVTFATLDVTRPEIEGLQSELGIEALPAFHFYKGGQPVGTPVTGYKKTPLKTAVESVDK